MRILQRLFKLLLIFLCGLSVKSQECPCVKTAVIGNDTLAGYIHNNRIVAMNDTIITSGNTLDLRVIKSSGSVSWVDLSSKKLLKSARVAPNYSTKFIAKSSLTGCPDVYDTVLIKVSGRTNIKGASKDITLYPNPASDKLTVYTKLMVESIIILNIHGVELLKLIPNNHTDFYEFDISEFTNGVYLISVKTESRVLPLQQFTKN